MEQVSVIMQGMEPLDLIVLGLVGILTIILWVFAVKNRNLAKENTLLRNIIEVKEKTIKNLESHRVLVKDVIENLSESERVMKMLEEGKSKEEIAKVLQMPLDKVEMIIKFDKIKKGQIER
ncbi:hypothetical protein MNB_SV-4-529 [hydrothermal vent metagenome]|uniref:Uncharacterized protein n=1 Tax=hydrothermal vent metagenome TaxID=652676 RepID=A0A1W1EAI2_9ZZZZ